MAGGASVAEIADTIGRPIRFIVPEDPIVPSSINSGVPAVISKPKSRFAAAVKSIVIDVMQAEALTPERARRSSLLRLGR